MVTKDGDVGRVGRVSSAAATVNTALEALDQDDRARVLHAAAALFGVELRAERVVDGQSKYEGQIERSDSKGGGGPALAPARRRSLAELVREKAPATNSQRIALFAYYRERYESKQNFARADLLPYFATAKVGKPGNYPRDFGEAVREGWIHEDGAQSYLTTTGTEAVEAGFGGKAKPRGAAVRKRRRSGDG